MPEAFAELQGNDAYILVTENKEELDQMIAFIGEAK